jgi:hypothetical protein
MPDEVARIGALSNGSNGQRSLESASLHFEANAELRVGSTNPECRFCAKYPLTSAARISRPIPQATHLACASGCETGIAALWHHC